MRSLGDKLKALDDKFSAKIKGMEGIQELILSTGVYATAAIARNAYITSNSDEEADRYIDTIKKRALEMYHKAKEKEIADAADSAQATKPFVPRKKSLYDQLCAAINLIEEVWNGSAKDVSENIDIAYDYLVEVQNNWEEAIGQTDDH